MTKGDCSGDKIWHLPYYTIFCFIAQLRYKLEPSSEFGWGWIHFYSFSFLTFSSHSLETGKYELRESETEEIPEKQQRGDSILADIP